MAEIEDNIRKSNAIEEILGKSPPWIIRTGSILMFIYVAVLIGLGFWIRYPEILSGAINITTKTPPTELVARVDGRLQLLVNNDAHVKEGELIAYIKNTASIDEILELSDRIAFLEKLVNDPAQIKSNYDSLPQYTNLGEVQSAYNGLMNMLSKYDVTYSLEKRKHLISDNNDQKQTLKRKEQVLRSKQRILEEELRLAADVYFQDSSLYTSRLISKLEVDESKSRYLNAKRGVQANRQTIIETKQQFQYLEYGVDELSLDDSEMKEQINVDLHNSFNLLKTYLQAYKEKYFFISPINGTVSFFDFWNNNQYVKQRDKVAFIVVDSEDILGKLVVSGHKLGKVKPGQKVRIKLESYPMSEYGVIFAKVDKVSKVNQNNFYVIDVDLNNGLVTSYKKRIKYSQEMKGLGEIITEDMSLIERIFYSVRSIGQQEFLEEKPKK